MLTGRCLCGGARYEIDGEIGSATYCHCSQCRRASGTAFATNASVRAEHFRLVAGRDLLTEYESSPEKLRAFCARCGSPVLSRWAAHPDFVRIRLGTLGDDPRSRPRFRRRRRGPIPSRTFVTPRNMKRRKPIACLLSACRRQACGTRAGPKSAAGRRGRRRGAYEAPRAAADGGTRLGGAESKRRRRPRLHAPPSQVTTLLARAT